MDFNYNIMRFGKKGCKITVVHLRKPVTKGLAGMVMSSFFPQNISLVVDSHPVSDLDYTFMCLSRNAGNESVSIWMEEDAFYGIKRGNAEARTALFHELGHYYHQHLKHGKEAMDAYDEARSASIDAGQVIREELEADLFAAEYLGRDYVIAGLSALKSRLDECILRGDYDEATGAAAIKELDLRIEALARRAP